MDKKTLVELIEKYLNGTCTAAEEQRLMEWYDAQDETPSFTSKVDKQVKVALEEEMFLNINQQILRPSRRTSHVLKLKNSTWLGIVAAIIIVIFTIPTYKYLTYNSLSLKTTYGEVKAVALPDDSKIILNGNSSITYESGKEREVWLDGEAFFHVTHKADGRRFLVHLADTLTIEVVGTEFNVQNRPSGVQVALKSGKINLINGNKRIIMQPNEVIQIGKYAADGFERSSNHDIGNQLAWQHNRLVLENTTLAELLGQLAETHGIQTSVHEDSLLERKASGSIPVGTDSELLLNHVGTLYGLVIAETNNERQYVLTAPK